MCPGMTMNSARFARDEPMRRDHRAVRKAVRVVGDVVIGEECSVWPMTAIRGDVNIIRIGNRTNIQDGTVI